MVLGTEGPKNVVEPTQISSEAVCLTGFRRLFARWGLVFPAVRVQGIQGLGGVDAFRVVGGASPQHSWRLGSCICIAQV